MRKTIFIFLFLCILLSSFVLAVPPVQTSSTIDSGIGIEYPQYEYIKNGNYFKLHTHIYNKTSGLHMNNNSADCFVHLYNATGDHIIEERMGGDSNLEEFKLYIGDGNFTRNGQYAYIIYCNTTAINNIGGVGGFVSGTFEVTHNGLEEEKQDSTTAISITLFLLSISIMLFYLGFREYKSKHKYLCFIIKRSCLVIAVYFMTLVSAIMATFSEYSSLGINNEMFLIMQIFGWAGYIAMVILTFGSAIQLLNELKADKQHDRTGGDYDD